MISGPTRIFPHKVAKVDVFPFFIAGVDSDSGCIQIHFRATNKVTDEGLRSSIRRPDADANFKITYKPATGQIESSHQDSDHEGHITQTLFKNFAKRGADLFVLS